MCIMCSVGSSVEQCYILFEPNKAVKVKTTVNMEKGEEAGP